MTVAKKVVIFAHSFVGLEIIKYFTEHYSDDLLQVVVMQKESDIYTYAKNNRIKVSIYGSNEYVNFISSNEFDTGFLIWWPKIISKELLTKAKNGFINTHPSFLPFCKGKHYNFWTLVKNCKFGVTLHYVDEGIDTGDIICQKAIEYDWLDNGQTLFEKARSEMINLFKAFYPKYREDKISRIKQDPQKNSYHHSSEIDIMSRLDLSKNYLLKNILNLLRARTFFGHPACFFEDPETKKEYEVRISIREKNKNK